MTAIACVIGSIAAAQRTPGIDVELVFANDAAHPGSTVHAALKVKLPEGYHVNSIEPLEDFLIPTVLSIDATERVSIDEYVYPEAEILKFAFSPEPMAVYEEEFAIGVALRTAESVEPGEYTISGNLRYQMCDDRQCLAPTTKDFTSTLTVVPKGTPLQPQHDTLFAGLEFGGESVEPLPPPQKPSPIRPAESDVDTDALLAKLGEFEILGMEGGTLSPDSFIQFIEDAEAGRVRGGIFEGRRPIAILAIVVVGGLALNLTPCVLPLIPINLAIIGAGAKAGSRLRGFLLGGAYGLAMALVYGVLGLVVILTAGTFGAINSTIWFNVSIAVLFFVLGLAMFDVIRIDFSHWQSKFNLPKVAKKGSFILAFGMGGIAALLAGACVAPVVIQVIVFSSDLYAEGTTIALALPFFLGVGMALPWPFAGGGMSFLPKPGPWMVRIKQALGLFILGFALYYAYLAYGIWENRNVDPEKVQASVESMVEKGWTPSLWQGLQKAQAEDKLVLIDMWATWCKNCLVMDETTLRNERVTARLEDYVKIKFQAEDPNTSPAKDVMAKLDAIGLPTYVILRPKSGDA